MAKKGKLTSSASKKAHYGAYPAKYERNRREKLARHVKDNPEDLTAAAALEKNSFPYRRQLGRKAPVRATRPAPKASPERTQELEKMLKIHVKNYLPKIKEPAYREVLRGLYDALRPKIRYKKRRNKKHGNV